MLVDLNVKQYYQLNETASLMWRGLANGSRSTTSRREMTELYDVTIEHAQSSVETVVGQFIAHHWVK